MNTTTLYVKTTQTKRAQEITLGLQRELENTLQFNTVSN